MHNQYFPLWVTGELTFSDSAGDKSYLLFYDDFNLLRTFFKFEPGTTQNEIFPLWVIGYLDFAKVARHTWNRRFYDDFDMGRYPTSFLRYEWREDATFQKVPETTHTSCFTMILMSLVHSSSFSLVRSRTSFLRYERLDNVMLLKLPGTAEITGIWWSDGCSTLFKFKPFTTHKFSPLWVTGELNVSEGAGDNSTSRFMMILMFLVLSASFCLVRRRTNFH